MIVGSVLLILVALVLLGLGLAGLDQPLLYASILVSGLSALALIAGIRRFPAAARAAQHASLIRGPHAGSASGLVVPTPRVRGAAAPRSVGRATPKPVGRARPPSPVAHPLPDGPADADLDALADQDHPVPPDEPAEQLTTQRDIERLATLDAEVLVVDGRPRYHLEGCLHLLGREADPVPVAEAAEWGFTPCGVCRPAATLLRVADQN